MEQFLLFRLCRGYPRHPIDQENYLASYLQRQQSRRASVNKKSVEEMYDVRSGKEVHQDRSSSPFERDYDIQYSASFLVGFLKCHITELFLDKRRNDATVRVFTRSDT